MTGPSSGTPPRCTPDRPCPTRRRWRGSPAQPTDVDSSGSPRWTVSTRRRVVFATVQLVNLLLLGPPLAFVVVVLAYEGPQLAALLDPELADFAIYLTTGWSSPPCSSCAVLVGLVFVGTVPRVLNLFITPDKVYPLYGFHYWVHRAIARTTNSKFYIILFGGTSYVVHYLRWLGYDLHEVLQTGSNFGEDVKHDTRSSLGRQRNDGRGQAVHHQRRFLEHVVPPVPRVDRGGELPGEPDRLSRAGQDGRQLPPRDEGHGSPRRTGARRRGPAGRAQLRDPRSVKRDQQLNVRSADELRRGLMAKNVYNTITMALFLLIRWILFFAVTVLYLAAVDLWANLGALVFALATARALVVSVAYNVLIERLVRPLQALRPQGCSIYDRAFWRHERFWKLTATPISTPSTAPFKNVLWRLRVCGSAAGLRRRLPRARADVHRDWGRLHAQR